MHLDQFKALMNVPPASREWYRGVCNVTDSFWLVSCFKLNIKEARRIILEVKDNELAKDILLTHQHSHIRATATLRFKLSYYQLQEALRDPEEIVRFAAIANVGTRSVVKHLVFFRPEYQEIACHYHRPLLQIMGKKRFTTFADTIDK